MTKIDLAKGFHQVPVRVVDRQKTTFWEMYQYRYMPFRLRNPPATFQRLMDVILNDVLMFSRTYIDDIVIFSTCFDDHCMHLVIGLQKLKDACPTVKQSKCEWAVAVCN